MSSIKAGAVAAALALCAAGNAGAWDRSKAETFAVVPDIAPGIASTIEGLTVGPDGNVYTPSFGFNSAGAVPGSVPNGALFVFSPEGGLVRQVAIQGSSPHLLGLAFNPVNHKLLVCDFGAGKLLDVNPVTGASKLFYTAPAGAGLNALTFDRKGNVYVSDSFNGAVYTMGPNGESPKTWVSTAPLGNTGNPASVELGPGTGLTPPFGANGVEFNNAGTALYIANTAYHTIIKVPVNADGTAGTPSVLVTGINAPDGIAIDKHDNIWVCANQQDEIVVIDPTGKVLARLGDFDGIAEDGTHKGLLFPASPAFSADGKFLLVANLALYLPYAGVPVTAVDSQWTLKVRHYSVSRIPARIPGQGDDD